MGTIWPEHFQAEVVQEGFGAKLTGYTIALEAWRRGLEVTLRDPIFRRYTVRAPNGREIRFLRSRPHMTTRDGVRIANNKHRTSQLLRRAGISAPQSLLVSTSAVDSTALWSMGEEIGYPVVLKPLDGSMGRGVYSGIEGPSELIARYEDLMTGVAPKTAVLEKHVPGEDFRVLVYGDEVLGVCQRIPANVVGDGTQSVSQLIHDKNALRRNNPFLSKGLITCDNEVDYFLSRHGLNYDSVPTNGQHIQLRSAANASAGGDVVDVSDHFPEQIKQAAIDSVEAVPGLFCAGVDVLYSPTSSPSYTILELNAHPQIGVNMYPTKGIGQDIPRGIIDICFPESSRTTLETDKQLALPSLEELTLPLKTGASSGVTINPIPVHHFNTRRYGSYPFPNSVTSEQKLAILKEARRKTVSGFFKRESSRLVVFTAGSPKAVEDFSKVTEKILGIEGASLQTEDNSPVALFPGLHLSPDI